jgi:CheY-like chemotaxis protein
MDIHDEIQEHDNVYLKFSITDTGCGITQSERPKLFKSFSQIDNHVTAKIYQGTGLGLAISKELVELMCGCIWLDKSIPTKGSTFCFVISCKVSEDVERKDDFKECILKNINVLILDDNLVNRLSVSGMITKWGMKPHAYSNSEEALYFARLIKFDIGLIDICMPKIDGPAFATRLKEQKEYKNNSFPLIALSSFTDKISINPMLFKSHLLKPIKESKLKQICIQTLQDTITPNNDTNYINNTTEHNSKPTLQSYMIQNDITTLKDNIRILLAEDVYINQKVIISFLNKLGFHNITTADNGQQCYELFLKNTFDVILLDIRMPIMDGEVVLTKIIEHCNKNQYTKKPYIIAVTAYCLKEDKDKYLSMGFDDYIPKPVALSTLRQCMDAFTHNQLCE